VIDTGCNASLTLPPAVIAALQLPWQSTGHGILADGSAITFDVYQATVVWDRRRRQIPVVEADAAPLVGMALLEGYELTMQVRPGGKVTIKRLA
jgi:clan AA aspartic protease